MSRGLSKNQRRILGIAYGVNLATVGGKVKAGAPVDRYNVPTVDYVGIKDVNWNIAAHLIYGLPFLNYREKVYTRNNPFGTHAGMFDMKNKATKSAKAATTRAITSLMNNGHLIYAPDRRPFMRCGYVLTAKGFEVGNEHAETVSDWLIYRAGIPQMHEHSFARTLEHIPDLLAAGVITLNDIATEARKHSTNHWHGMNAVLNVFADYALPTATRSVVGNSYPGNRSVTAVTDNKVLPTSQHRDDGNGYLIDGCAEVVEMAK